MEYVAVSHKTCLCIMIKALRVVAGWQGYLHLYNLRPTFWSEWKRYGILPSLLLCERYLLSPAHTFVPMLVLLPTKRLPRSILWDWRLFSLAVILITTDTKNVVELARAALLYIDGRSLFYEWDTTSKDITRYSPDNTWNIGVSRHAAARLYLP
jgi:hypothetical protein